MVSDLVLSLALIVLSLIWGYVGIFQLGLWVPGVSADSGFIPTVFSAVNLVCAAIILIRALKKKRSGAPADDPSAEETAATGAKATKTRAPAFIRQYSIILFAVGGVLCLRYLGLVPMTFLLVFGWMKLMNRYPWVKSIAMAGIVTVSIYLIFDVWLKIPFPGLI